MPKHPVSRAPSLISINFLLGEREVAHVIADSGIDTVVTIPPLASRLKDADLKIIDLTQLPKAPPAAITPKFPNPAADDVAVACSLDVDKRIALSREALHALDGKDVFRHPFLDKDIKLMYGEHVTADTGTGLVHTAPGHGYEDFVVGAQYGLKPFTPVDDAGVFTKDGGEWAGRNVFEANPSIVEHLKKVGALLHSENIGHSYPHCWRCKNPLIFRATEQWFLRVDHKDLRRKILAQIDAVR